MTLLSHFTLTGLEPPTFWLLCYCLTVFIRFQVFSPFSTSAGCLRRTDCVVTGTLYKTHWLTVGLTLPRHENTNKNVLRQNLTSHQKAAGRVATCVLHLRSLCHGNRSAHLSARSSGAPAAAAHRLSVGSLSLTRVGRGQSVKGESQQLLRPRKLQAAPTMSAPAGCLVQRLLAQRGP